VIGAPSNLTEVERKSVEDAVIGATQNMGGSGASSVVHIFERV